MQLDEALNAKHALTVRDVAAALSIHTLSLYRMCKQGKFPHFRIASCIRISPQQLAHYLEFHQVGSK